MTTKNSITTPTKFAVTDDCTDCGLCYDMAPEIFKYDAENWRATAFSQPESPAQLALAIEAQEACPVEAIVRDE